MSTTAGYFKCIKCGDQPDTLEALRRHITVEHLRWIPFECLFCEVFKATEMQLREHVQAKHPGKPFRLILVSDPTNQQRLQQLIDQSTCPAIDNSQSASSTRSPAAIETDQKCFPAPRNISVAKLNSLNGSILTKSPAALQQSLNQQLAATTTLKSQAKQGIDNTSDLCVKPEILDNSSVTSSLQTSLSTTSATNATVFLRAPKRLQRAAALLSEPKRACRKRSQDHGVRSQFNYTGTDTNYCRVCKAKRSHASPVGHIYFTHIEEDAVICKYCSYTCRYDVSNVIRHIRRNHQGKAVESGFEDRRKEFEPRVQQWIRRCFGKEDYEESDVESAESPQPQTNEGANALSDTAPERSFTVTRAVSTSGEAQNADSGSPMTAAAAKQPEKRPLEDQSHGTDEAPTPKQSMEAETVATEDNPGALVTKLKAGQVAVACKECDKQVRSKHQRSHIFARHLKAKPIHCNYCDYSVRQANDMKRHLRKNHSSKDQASGFGDRRGQFEAQYSEWKTRCFPKAMPKQRATSANKLCSSFRHLCQQAVFERKQLHADSKHLQLPLLSCKFCDYTRPHSVAHMNRHLAIRHPNEPSLNGFIDRRVEFVAQRQAMRQKCFGSQTEPERTADNAGEATD